MEKIGVLGTGLMGKPLALRLAQQGYTVFAYNRTPEKLVPLQSQGIYTSSEVKTVVQNCDRLILMLTDGGAIREVLLSGDHLNLLPEKTIIQMGTIAPAISRILAEELQTQGVKYLEAPVLGSIPEVKSGQLLVMAGGNDETFRDCLPLLQALSPHPQLIGPVGSGAALKLALNQLIAGLTSSFALSLGFVQKEGVDVEQFMAILRESALYAPTFDKKLSRMGDRYFANPNFPTKHLLKDTKLFLQEADSLHLNTEALGGVQKILNQAIAQGLADQDYSSLFNAINPPEN